MPSFIVTDDENKQVPSGVQILEVIEAVEKVSKTGNEMIVIKLEAKNGGTVTDYLVFSEKSAFKLRQFIEAGTGKKLNKGDSVELTDEKCMLMKPLWAIVGPDDQNPQFQKVKKYLTKEQAAELQKEAASAESEDEIPF